jgi:hypothetical protein
MLYFVFNPDVVAVIVAHDLRGRGVIENKHSTDVETTIPDRAFVRTLSLKVRYAPVSVR